MAETIPFKTLHSREYQGHKKKVHSVAWNCSGTKLASGSVDQTARIWQIEPHGHYGEILHVPVQRTWWSDRKAGKVAKEHLGCGGWDKEVSPSGTGDRDIS
ncbi:hypothetical protein MTR67_033432 [Solanum verrucosum]|uniref:Uncharacterized protein n=1 Tax=Solanum verrucosum TaxID=315347 RepID=A0AAF0U6C3_SOLVR|nr:hypothetical protein MTR67_033432 [Solanum verrucosum]